MSRSSPPTTMRTWHRQKKYLRKPVGQKNRILTNHFRSPWTSRQGMKGLLLANHFWPMLFFERSLSHCTGRSSSSPPPRPPPSWTRQQIAYDFTLFLFLRKNIITLYQYQTETNFDIAWGHSRPFDRFWDAQLAKVDLRYID